jgi:hypothetical protein
MGRWHNPEAMSDDLMLGHYATAFGAVLVLSSWNSAMVNLLRRWTVGEALVRIRLGSAVDVAHRFGQHIAVYITNDEPVRRELMKDEDTGIRVSQERIL